MAVPCAALAASSSSEEAVSFCHLGPQGGDFRHGVRGERLRELEGVEALGGVHDLELLDLGLHSVDTRALSPRRAREVVEACVDARHARSE